MRWFLGKARIYHEPPDWAIFTEMGLAFHTPPWIIEEQITPEWLSRWNVWKAETPKK